MIRVAIINIGYLIDDQWWCFIFVMDDILIPMVVLLLLLLPLLLRVLFVLFMLLVLLVLIVLLVVLVFVSMARFVITFECKYIIQNHFT